MIYIKSGAILVWPFAGTENGFFENAGGKGIGGNSIKNRICKQCYEILLKKIYK